MSLLRQSPFKKLFAIPESLLSTSSFGSVVVKVDDDDYNEVDD